MKPAEELRAAVTKLRGTAANCTQGTWRYSPGSQRNDYDKAEVVAEEGGWIVAKSNHRYESDFVWIALMGPAALPGITALLEHYAEAVAWSDNWDDIRNCGKPIKQFARTILGEA